MFSKADGARGAVRTAAFDPLRTDELVFPNGIV